MPLFGVVLKVKLKPEHPLHRHVEYGALWVFLIAPDESQAVQSVGQICKFLPYDLSPARQMRTFAQPFPESLAMMTDTIRLAEQVGLALFFQGLDYADEGDEERFLNEPFP